MTEIQVKEASKEILMLLTSPGMDLVFQVWLDPVAKKMHTIILSLESFFLAA